MPTRLITLEPIAAELVPADVDDRLAAGWFPFGQRWMTCRAWPSREGVPWDTVWIRVALEIRRPSDRHRRLLRAGYTTTWHAQPVFDDEHQDLYTRFRDTLHPDWETTEAPGLLRADDATRLLDHTREIAIRDPLGNLVAFRWFVQGQTAIAGVSAVYDPTVEGLGTIARTSADQWAARAGLRWTYPGYVLPGSPDPWYYKLQAGRTWWLDPSRHAYRWRDWEADPPRQEQLTLARMRGHLEILGEVETYPYWANPCFDGSRGLDTPYYVVGSEEGDRRQLYTWDVATERYETLHVIVQRREPSGGEDPSDLPKGP